MSSKLNVKQWLTAAIAVFVAVSVVRFLLNLVVTALLPAAAGPATTPENIWMLRLWNYLGRACFALVFAYVFTRGYEGKPWAGEGFRYGLWIGLLIWLPWLFGTMVSTTPAVDFLLSHAVTGVIETIVSGMVVALVYKSKPRPAA